MKLTVIVLSLLAAALEGWGILVVSGRMRKMDQAIGRQVRRFVGALRAQFKRLRGVLQGFIERFRGPKNVDVSATDRGVVFDATLSHSVVRGISVNTEPEDLPREINQALKDLQSDTSTTIRLVREQLEERFERVEERLPTVAREAATPPTHGPVLLWAGLALFVAANIFGVYA